MGGALHVQEEIEEEREGRVMGTGEADDDARRQGPSGIQGRYHARDGPLNVAFTSLSGNRPRPSVNVGVGLGPDLQTCSRPA